MSSKHWNPCGSATTSTLIESSCVDFRWAARARGTSACIIPDNGPPSKQARDLWRLDLRQAAGRPHPSINFEALHIYDSLDYAENIANVPTVGYGGEIDPQLKASQQIQKAVAGMPRI